ncbi:solute carrier family 25 member 36-like [Ylistrum balloti]|uniref:solute carrier family 25 member 36-like n=1 Tax=Ylistrum balloti TaxID=509963 RepID=UPI002905E922|nr:solute carrier family 25 member 36-like [Ylistrum balloti]
MLYFDYSLKSKHRGACMASNDQLIHLAAGGLGGTAGAVLTCPLEVVKTRLQSSTSTFHYPAATSTARPTCLVSNYSAFHSTPSSTFVTIRNVGTIANVSEVALVHARSRSIGLYFCLRQIVLHEGIKGLFKGLGPNLIGVIPSRAIYFYSYANMKKFLNTRMNPDTSLVHIYSAITAGFCACTTTNPIWFIKTKLQLDQKRTNSLTCIECIKNTYRTYGLPGFYKGITASYVGITETVIHFVIYEALKEKLKCNDNLAYNSQKSEEPFINSFFRCMLAGAISKTFATCIAYPHEVARTRLREDGNKYQTFIQTLRQVCKEGGIKGMYGGLCTQLVRQIPNTAIMMATYEGVVYYFNHINYGDDT